MRHTRVWVLTRPSIGWVILGKFSGLSAPRYLIHRVEKKVTSTWQICREDLRNVKCLPRHMASLRILSSLLSSLCPAGIFRLKFPKALISLYRLL